MEPTTAAPDPIALARRLLAALVVVTAALLAAPHASASPGVVHAPLRTAAAQENAVTSANWAGYALTGTDPVTTPSFRSVSARWVQPTATCTPGRATFSAFWVGLGGFSEDSQALEQIGTDTDCTAAGKPAYSMWYELVPAPSVPVALKIFPGNVIAASVAVNGATVSLQLQNVTRKTRFTKVLRAPLVDVTSAEWVAEAPSTCDRTGRCTVLPLTNFGTVSFSSAAATAAGSISEAAWAPTMIQLVPDGAPPAAGATPVQTAGAVPSPLSPDASAFSVAWQAAPVPPAGAERGRIARVLGPAGGR
jgi:Peptidase A4 family